MIHPRIEHLVQKKHMLVNEIVSKREKVAKRKLIRLLQKLWNNPLKQFGIRDKYLMKACKEYGLQVDTYHDAWSKWYISIPGDMP